MDAFDADVLIYAAFCVPRVGAKIAALFPDSPLGQGGSPVGVGSVLLVPELLSKPLREHAEDEVAALSWLLARLELWPLDASIADLAAVLGAKHGLRAADGVHLATAVRAGADRFLTNNRKDFRKTIDEIDVIYPDEL